MDRLSYQNFYRSYAAISWGIYLNKRGRNLLLPIGSERLSFGQRARYIFVVYRADGLPDMSSLCRKSDFENINPYVQISFAGMKVR